MTNELILAGFFALFGLAFGSFLNVCIHRLPRRIVLLDERDELLRQQAETAHVTPGSPGRTLDEVDRDLRALSIWRTRSGCPHCRHRIAGYDNIPVLSWLLLRGRCRQCHGPISPRYLVVEILTAALFVSCYLAFDATWMAVKLCAFSFFIVGLIFTDAEWKLLPDALTLPGLGIGLISSLIVPVRDLIMRALIPAFRAADPSGSDYSLGLNSIHSGWRLLSLAQSAGGAIAGAAFIYGAGVLYMRMRPDLRRHGHSAMGLGDVKLMAMIGSFLGLTLTAVTMFAASIGGAGFGVFVVLRVWLKRLRRQRSHKTAGGRAWQSAMLAFRYFQVPFGVFLGVAAIIAAFFGNDLVRWYAGFFV